MGVVFRQAVKTSLVVFSGAFLGAIILWLSTRYIPKQEYGFISTFTKWSILLAGFTPLGLSSTLSVFIHRYNDDLRKRKMLITLCLLVPLIIAIIISMAYCLLPEYVIGHFQPGDALLMRKYYFWLPIYMLLFVYMGLLEQYLCSQMKVAISAFMREILLRLLNIVLIILFAFGYIGFPTLLTGTVLIYVVPVLIFFLLSFKTHGFGFTFDLRSFSAAEYKEILHFSWYHYLIFMLGLALTYMDALLIPFYDHSGFTSVAVYSAAVYFISIINMPSRAFTQASFSALAKAFANNEFESAKDIFVRASVNLLIPTIAIALIMCCNLDNIIAITGSGRNYSGVGPIFLILLIGVLVNIATGMNDQVLSIAKYYKFSFYVSLVIIVMFYALIRLLVPRFGITGAAWSATTSIMAYNLVKFYIVWKKTGMQPFSKSTLFILVCAVPALGAGYFFPYFFNPDRHVYVHTFIDAALRSTVVLVVYITMLLWLKPSKDLEDYVASVRQNKRLF